MSQMNVIEILLLATVLVTGIITKRRTKRMVQELDGLSPIHRKGDCPGTLVASVHAPREKPKKRSVGLVLSGLALAGLSLSGIGIYAGAAAGDVEPAYLTLQGRVEVQGDDWNGSMADFRFTISGEGYPETEAVADENGTIFFGGYTYLREGTYQFTIRQSSGGADGITYDTEAVQITVEASQSGPLVELGVRYKKAGAETDGIYFQNIYTEPVAETEMEPEPVKPAATPEPETVRESEPEGALAVSRTPAKVSGHTQAGIRVCSYTITIRNEGERSLYGIYVRDYMAEYTVYAGHEGDGAYGAIEGKEHLTLFIEELKAGECLEIRIECQMKECVPDDYIPESQTRYEVRGNKAWIYTNDPGDPVYLYTSESEEQGT